MVKERKFVTPEELAHTAVLSDLGIQYEMERRNIVIDPYNPENLSTSSYDLILGENYFVRAKVAPGTLNLYNPNIVPKIWGELKKAVLVEEFKRERGQFLPADFWEGIKDDDRVIVVPPSGVLLVHSHEFAGARRGYTTMIRSRSTVERLGITVTISAGWGDVGFFGPWVVMLENKHNSKVPLLVGMPFIQIIFFRCGPTGVSYVEGGGRYQDTEDLEKLKKSWEENPAKYMLPKILKS